MKIFLDDTRATPDGFIRCYWPDEVVKLLQEAAQNNIVVECISLDHDLGDDLRGTGYDVLTWLEREIFHNKEYKLPLVIKIHSANPAAREKMRAACESIENISLRNFKIYGTSQDFNWILDWYTK